MPFSLVFAGGDYGRVGQASIRDRDRPHAGQQLRDDLQDPAGNLKPAKDNSSERIDGIVALIMAIGRAIVAQDEPQPSYQMFVL